VAYSFDAPWEGPISSYVTIFKYGNEKRMYYRAARGEEPPVYTAVALSPDGIRWRRPELGLYEFGGSRRNNAVWTGDSAHNLAPFVDANPAALPTERFKAVGSGRLNGEPVLLAFCSEDGYRWRPWREEPIITDGAFDSHNVVFWDALRGHYVAFYRDFRGLDNSVQRWKGVRSVKFATSPDFAHWTPGQWEDYGDTPLEHLYTNATISYFRAPHFYLSFPRRFMPERKKVPAHPVMGVSDGVFMSSRDGLHWRRFMEAFVRPGPDQDNWTDRCGTFAWGILQTGPAELSLYWGQHFRHPDNRLRRGTLRLDGFASLRAGYAGGEALTHPFLFQGRELVLNYATSAAGSVQAELQDAEGRPLPGYTLEESPELYGDEVEHVFRWRNGADVSALAGRPVRLRLVLRDADIYALRFR
jgi:hypothetical protein